MEDLKAKLAEVDEDLKALTFKRGKLLVEQEALKKQIAEAEVTYSIGDRFNMDNGKDKAILAMIRPDNVCLIGLSDGNRFASPVTVCNSRKITQEELNSLSGYVDGRCWDVRKQCKC